MAGGERVALNYMYDALAEERDRAAGGAVDRNPEPAGIIIPTEDLLARAAAQDPLAELALRAVHGHNAAVAFRESENQ